jgi:cold-inducible RNA-binding protein
MNIYVGNLSSDVSEDDLQQAFKAFGQIATVTIIKDKFSGESRGFGFVEMPSKDEAQAAIEGLNGKDLKGQSLNVNEARPRAERRGGKGGYSGSRGGQWGGKGGYSGSKGGYGSGKGKYGSSKGGRRGNR